MMVAEVSPAVSAPNQNGGYDGSTDIDSLKLDLRTHLDQRHCYHQQDVHSDCSDTNDDEGNRKELAINKNALSLLSGGGEESNGPNVFVSDSTGVHVGTKNYYQGPVTIKKIVYTGNGEIPFSAQNGVELTDGMYNMNKDKSAENINSAIGDIKLEKPTNKVDNSFKIHMAKLRFNTPLHITLIVSTLLIIGLITLLVVFLKGNSAVAYATDSEEQLQHPRPTNDTPHEHPLLPYSLVTRSEWVAQPAAKAVPPLTQPTPFVILHQTDTENCVTLGDCIFIVRYLQTYHIDGKKLWDIAYNFLVGGDGRVYEGRGWTSEGAHTFNYNSRSVGIALIGTFENARPGKEQLKALNVLIDYGISAGHLKENYKLIGQRQVESSQNPDPNDLPPNRVKVITRREWLAQDPSGPTDPLEIPVANVIIWHTATENCTTQITCTFSVKNIQAFHIQAQKWYDIAYNFLIGGDGYVYEGRGWFTEGSHTKFYNKYSVGIGFIGTFSKYMPPKRQINAAKNLIAWGVNESYIQPNYKLFGARQLSSTESPGDMLQQELQTWPHWNSGKP